MKHLPIGIQTFKMLRKDDLLYVDKTEQIYKLLLGGRRWFLSRPRRFGKSLTLSTLESIFKGEKQWFKGLWIEDKIEWEQFPVLRFSFDLISSKDNRPREVLINQLRIMARQLGVGELNGEYLKDVLTELIQKAATEKPVVILVDEYDKPILDGVPDDMARAENARLVVKEFFETLKTEDANIHFIFVTGVTKFSKTGMFSGANQLEDISLDARFSTICGYTQAEIEHHFSEAFPRIAQTNQIEESAVLAEIKKWYNGYNWLGEPIYNPWSILMLVAKGRIDNYWFTSGSPEFLIKILKNDLYYKLPNLTVNKIMLETFNIEKVEYRALLFQSGYLTIKSENPKERTFTLGFPNYEIEESLLTHLLGAYTETNQSDAGISALDLRNALQVGDIEQAVNILNSLFADIPHQIFLAKKEAYFHSILHIVFTMLGFYVKSEVSTSKGRTDVVVELVDKIYVIEFKLNDTTAVAIKQIKDNGYADKYMASGKKVILLGFSFSTDERAIIDYDTE